ncbi:hypothetical protein BgiMline_004666 [Biomphalaria glabrata]|nr:hypothetical protein BgiMline_002764 [Biomphalaria glabrata]
MVSVTQTNIEPPHPDTCKRMFGYSIYRNKNVQMCLLIRNMNMTYGVDFRRAQAHCSIFGGRIGIFDTKEKLEILQRQTRCLWVNFIGDDSGYIWGTKQGFIQVYNEAKHSHLFFGGQPFIKMTKSDLNAGPRCGIYSNRFRLLTTESCYSESTESSYKSCFIHEVCEKSLYTRDDL